MTVQDTIITGPSGRTYLLSDLIRILQREIGYGTGAVQVDPNEVAAGTAMLTRDQAVGLRTYSYTHPDVYAAIYTGVSASTTALASPTSATSAATPAVASAPLAAAAPIATTVLSQATIQDTILPGTLGRSYRLSDLVRLILREIGYGTGAVQVDLNEAAAGTAMLSWDQANALRTYSFAHPDFWANLSSLLTPFTEAVTSVAATPTGPAILGQVSALTALAALIVAPTSTVTDARPVTPTELPAMTPVTINDYRQSTEVVELDFSWSPHGQHSFTDPDGSVYAPDSAAGAILTFTATPKIGRDTFGYLTFTEFRWDFGDGLIGYGNPVQHIYSLPNFNAVTNLRVTDSYGKTWYARHQMYIGPPSTGQASLPLCFTR